MLQPMTARTADRIQRFNSASVSLLDRYSNSPVA